MEIPAVCFKSDLGKGGSFCRIPPKLDAYFLALQIVVGIAAGIKSDQGEPFVQIKSDGVGVA